MWITIIILAYVANVFLNRWINKILHRNYMQFIFPQGWFFGPICTMHFFFKYIGKVSNRFTGKHW